MHTRMRLCPIITGCLLRYRLLSFYLLLYFRSLRTRGWKKHEEAEKSKVSGWTYLVKSYFHCNLHCNAGADSLCSYPFTQRLRRGIELRIIIYPRVTNFRQLPRNHRRGTVFALAEKFSDTQYRNNGRCNGNGGDSGICIFKIPVSRKKSCFTDAAHS